MQTAAMANIQKWALIWSAVLTLCACASLFGRPEPPRMNLAGVDIINLGLIEQRFDLQLRVQNPNRYPLPVEGMDFVLQLNDRDFAHGVTNQPVTIPSFGETLVNVKVVSSLANIYAQLRNLAIGRGVGSGVGNNNRLRYKLSGGMALSNWAGKIPFESDGEIMLAPKPRGNRGRRPLLLHDPVP